MILFCRKFHVMDTFSLVAAVFALFKKNLKKFSTIRSPLPVKIFSMLFMPSPLPLYKNLRLHELLPLIDLVWPLLTGLVNNQSQDSKTKFKSFYPLFTLLSIFRPVQYLQYIIMLLMLEEKILKIIQNFQVRKSFRNRYLMNG